MADQEGSISSQRASRGNLLTGFLVALQFLSIFPAAIKRPITPTELGHSTGLYPAVGLIFGAILVGTNYLLSLIFPPAITAALTLSSWVILSGALHLDGFLDTCDGLFGGRTPEKRLEVMRDERVGAFALTGGVLLILTKFTALNTLANPTGALLVAPTLARWSMTVTLFAFPYAREQGLGRDIKSHTGLRQVLLASAIALVVAWLAGRELGLLAALASILIAWLGGRLIVGRIPGMTGDTYGAINEVIEVLVMLMFVVAKLPAGL
jgi:adenosylcobinamide-GDP ribazoletransferase